MNDHCGHVTGDAVLHNVGRALQTTLRTGDAAIRYGGEEFLLMFNDSDEAGAMRVAEAVREVLTKLPAPGNGVQRVTASIGVAFFPRHGAELEQVVNIADAAMYQAKPKAATAVVLAPDRRSDPTRLVAARPPAVRPPAERLSRMLGRARRLR